MSRLGEWIEGVLVGDRHPPATWGDLVGAVERHAGSGRKAAALLGVPETTWRRWRGGSRPVEARQSGIMRAFRQVALDPNRPGDHQVTMTAKMADGGRERSRRITAAGLDLKPGTMQRAADLYARTGDREAAAAAFVAGIGQGNGNFYSRALAKGMADDEGDYLINQGNATVPDSLPGMAP